MHIRRSASWRFSSVVGLIALIFCGAPAAGVATDITQDEADLLVLNPENE